MKSIQFISIIIVTLATAKVHAQDIHLSQFWNTPMLQNASNAGKAEGDIRAIVNHRSQWGSVTSNPFKTFGASFDMRLDKKSKDNFFGAGISMYTDVAGASKMRTTLVNVAAAYHIKINKENFLSAGLQGGINQRGFDNADLRFDNQFDGSQHNGGLSSNETFSNLSQLKPSVSAGISYMWSNSFGNRGGSTSQGKKTMNFGLAAHHFNAPRFDFTNNNEKLSLKYVASFEGSFAAASSKWTIKPAAFVAMQNKASNLVLGSLFKYAFNEDSQITDFKSSASLSFGGYYRVGDAVIPTIELQLASFDIAFSYDVNLSQLSGASKGQGGFEIGLKYISQSTLGGRKSRARYY
ncbi:MAG: PorP/SprF family type IX secretion system membrane protein [Crocinitomicaceae bacterium]|nr:PorP/SprF family type IX secretion system membrane protein [Crocinitomicaceae bacterium]